MKQKIRWLVFTLVSMMWVWPAAADQIQYLALPQQSLSAFAALIDRATTSIDISTYIYQPCDTSTRLLTQKLAAKAKAGVHVRVLIDAIELPLEQRPNLAAEFAKEGVEFRLYSNSLIDINLRTHSKVMVVDGRSYIAGGRNFADNYFDLSNTLNYVDRDVLVTGASASQAEASFNLLWNSDMVSRADGTAADFVDWNDFCGSDISSAVTAVQNYLQANAAEILQSVPVRSCPMQFTADNPDFFKTQYGAGWDNGNGISGFLTKSRLAQKSATQAVLNFVSGAQHDLFLENENYMPVTNLEAAFAGLRARDIPVRVLVNQDMDGGPVIFEEAEEYEVAKTQLHDSVGSEWIGLISSQGSLSTAFALTPNAPGSTFFMHSKVVVRDGTDVLIGSFNMDSRSANINLETAATITNCPALVGDVTTHFNEVYRQYAADQTSGQLPPKPDPNELEKLLGDLLLPEL